MFDCQYVVIGLILQSICLFFLSGFEKIVFSNFVYMFFSIFFKIENDFIVVFVCVFPFLPINPVFLIYKIIIREKN